jgi:ketosteroid isomerase-like protein
MSLVRRHLNILLLLLAGLVLPWSSLALPSPESDAVAADHSLTTAINTADRTSVEKLLHPEFSWTDRTGKTRSKSEILPALPSLASESDADVKIIDAGQVALIHGSHRIPSQNASVRFIRVWVKRSQAWQLLVYQETNKAEKNPEKRSGFGAPSNGQPVACENPCKTVPYKPDTAAEQEVVSMWQAVERTVLTNDVEAWTPNFTDDFIFVTPDGGSPLSKADRVTMITELRRTNTTLIPAEVTSMKVWVFGDAAVMRSEHKPLHGKVLHVTRLFEKRNGHWQIAFGQQTWVE